MSFVQVIILAVIQGLAELLPVSSSAHVIVAEKLMGLDPSAPEMTFLLVMLHTGTMFAVLLYFWRRWRTLLQPAASVFLKNLVIATAFTGLIGIGLKVAIEHTVFRGADKAEVEALFKNLPLMAASLGAAGLLILASGLRIRRREAAAAGEPKVEASAAALGAGDSVIIGITQGLCLPFRGFSRSGATISVGMLRRVPRELSESFSFALAVVLTPPVILLELHRLLKAGGGLGTLGAAAFAPGLAGMVFSFLAGLGALRWLSSWLETGKWHFFGIYCLAAAGVVAALAASGF